MIKFIFFTLLIVSVVSIVSCKGKTSDKSHSQATNSEDIKLGPIVHKSLSESQLEKVKFIQKTFSEVYQITLEETITNFKRDQTPDNEIDIWLNMAKTYKFYAEQNPEKEKLESRKEAFKLILMRSMMPEIEAISSSELKLLNENEIQEVLKNYILDAKPIKIKEK